MSENHTTEDGYCRVDYFQIITAVVQFCGAVVVVYKNLPSRG